MFRFDEAKNCLIESKHLQEVKRRAWLKNRSEAIERAHEAHEKELSPLIRERGRFSGVTETRDVEKLPSEKNCMACVSLPHQIKLNTSCKEMYKVQHMSST